MKNRTNAKNSKQSIGRGCPLQNKKTGQERGGR